MKTVTIEEYGVNTQYDVYTFGSGEPHITFTAGIHGNEVSGIYVAQRLIGHFIKNPPVKGTVKIIPTVNAAAMRCMQRRSPFDAVDLNRVFPGNESGSISHKLAASIYKETADADILVDLHCCGQHGLPYILSVYSESAKVRNLVSNPYFREQLPEADYAALVEAQRLELDAVDYVNRYFANYGTISELAEAYAAAQAEADAAEIYDKYKTLQGFNRVLADSLSDAWNYIFDNKSYAYGYLMDKLGRDEILSREEERLSEAARQLSELRGETASDAVTDYFLRKKVLVGYETSVADMLGLTSARDSLRGVTAQLEGIDFRLPRIDVAERYFLDYDSVSFSSTPKYSYQHPIPECKVYEHGTIYRILLGTFNTKRAVSTFRGAYPLSYLVNDDRKWCYYAGGFATREEAEAAQKLLKARGFVRPEIVVWTDGEYRNLSKDPEAQHIAYRVEIVSSEALSDAVKAAITDTAEGCELSRVGQQLFVVGTFDDKAVADRVAAAVTQTDPALEIKVAEIAE